MEGCGSLRYSTIRDILLENGKGDEYGLVLVLVLLISLEPHLHPPLKSTIPRNTRPVPGKDTPSGVGRREISCWLYTGRLRKSGLRVAGMDTHLFRGVYRIFP